MSIRYFNQRTKMKENLIEFHTIIFLKKEYIYSKSSNDFRVLINGVKKTSQVAKYLATGLLLATRLEDINDFTGYPKEIHESFHGFQQYIIDFFNR